jgi:molecular chaperone HtpG
MSETDLPILITQDEFMRRFQDMEKISGQKSIYGTFQHYNLIVNGNHPIAGKILSIEEKEKRDELVKQLFDLALLSQNLLSGEKLSEFVKRSITLL